MKNYINPIHPYSEIFKLYDENTKLKNEINTLKAHIEYMLNGSGYKEAEKHFLESIKSL